MEQITSPIAVPILKRMSCKKTIKQGRDLLGTDDGEVYITKGKGGGNVVIQRSTDRVGEGGSRSLSPMQKGALTGTVYIWCRSSSFF